MGNLALPCLVISQSHAYESVSVRHLFFTAIAAIRLPRQHVNDRLSAHYNSGAG